MARSGQSGDGDLKMVSGYLPHIDELPDQARRLGFHLRLAVVFETYRCDHPDMVFDAALYVSLLGAVKSALSCDRMEVLLEDGRTRMAMQTAEELTRGLDQELPEPYPRLTYFAGPEARAFVDAISWARVGGPEPYHDSYTIAFFADQPTIATIAGTATRVFRESGIENVPTIQADVQPRNARK